METATGPNEWRGREGGRNEESDNTPGRKTGTKSREERDSWLMGVRSGPTSVTEKRAEKEKTAPKALLYLSYNYHNRAPHRTPPLPTNPARAPRVLSQATTANWKLSNTFSLRRSLARSLVRPLVRSPRSKLFAVGRRPSSRKDANDSSTNTQSWNACSARG